MTGAYPPDADSIGIPIGIYCFFPFPFMALMTFTGRHGLGEKRLHLLWNPGRHFTSIVWTLVSIFPVGLWLYYLVADSIIAGSIPSLLYFSMLVIAVFIYRAGAISRPIGTEI